MGIFQKWFKGRKKEPRRSQGGYPGTAFSGLAPEGPDFRPHAFLIPIQTRFDEVFRKHGEYWDHVRSRFLAGHPDVSDSMYSWLLLEFKRFLAMNMFMKSVGMYSAMVDEIWHAALLFSREYQEFCHDLFGEMIHHSPHTGKSAKPGEAERAQFELVYSVLFEIHTESTILLGGFGRKKLEPVFVEHVLTGDVGFLHEHYFKNNPSHVFAASVQEFVKHLANVVQSRAELQKRLPTTPPNRSKAGQASGTGAKSHSREAFSSKADSYTYSGSDVNTLILFDIIDGDGSYGDVSCGSDSDRQGESDWSDPSCNGDSSCSSESSCSSDSSCSSSSCSSSSCSSSSCSSSSD